MERIIKTVQLSVKTWPGLAMMGYTSRTYKGKEGSTGKAALITSKVYNTPVFTVLATDRAERRSFL